MGTFIIAGSRAGICYMDVSTAIQLSGWASYIHEVVSGACPGEYSADMHGERWSRESLGREATQFPYIKELGRAGGPERNKQMALYAQERQGFLIAVPHLLRTSRGTASMIANARRLRLRMFVFDVSTGIYWWESGTGSPYGRAVYKNWADERLIYLRDMPLPEVKAAPPISRIPSTTRIVSVWTPVNEVPERFEL